MKALPWILGAVILALLAVFILVPGAKPPAGEPNATSTPPASTSTNIQPPATSTTQGAYKSLKGVTIRVSTPPPLAAISSPVTVKGEAPGTWYFEAVFPVIVTDSKGQVLGQGQAQAQGDWMTTKYVPFTATVEFARTATSTATGFIVLKKDNPSGIASKDDSLKIPVSFR